MGTGNPGQRDVPGNAATPCTQADGASTSGPGAGRDRLLLVTSLPTSKQPLPAEDIVGTLARVVHLAQPKEGCVALITSGSVEDFSVAPVGPSVQRLSREYYVNTAGAFQYLSDQFRADDYEFAVSKEPRGIALENLKLEKEAQKFFKRLFRRDSKVYFVAWGWDLGGTPAYTYPGVQAGAGDVLIPMRVGEVREFLGAGLPLFPTRIVTSGIQVRIQIWESRKGVRAFGSAMSEVGAAMD
jgi:hypothetical protein